MKFQKILFALAIATFVFIGCKNDAKKEVVNQVKQEITTADTKEFAMNISGMTCEVGCAKYIQSKLSKQEGVLEAKVVFTDSIATVKYDASKTNKASLVSLVNGLADNMYKASETKVCSSSAKKDCCKNKDTKACSTDKKACTTADAKKDCCKNKDAKSCSADKKSASVDVKDKDLKKCSTTCKMVCCTETKACNNDCKKDCCDA